MSELPVFFATTDGQTRRIAEAFAAHARFLGVDSHAIDVTSAQAADFSWVGVRAAVSWFDQRHAASNTTLTFPVYT